MAAWGLPCLARCLSLNHSCHNLSLPLCAVTICVPQTTSVVGPFAFRIIRFGVDAADCLCAWTDRLCVSAVVIVVCHSAKSFAPARVCRGCVIPDFIREKEKHRAIFPEEIVPDQAFLSYLFPQYQLEHLRFSERSSVIVTRSPNLPIALERQGSRKAQIFSTQRELTQGT